MNFTDFSGQRPFQIESISCQHLETKHQTKRTLRRLELLRLGRASNTSCEPSEGDDLLVLRDIAEIGVGFGELETCFDKN